MGKTFEKKYQIKFNYKYISNVEIKFFYNKLNESNPYKM